MRLLHVCSAGQQPWLRGLLELPQGLSHSSALHLHPHRCCLLIGCLVRGCDCLLGMRAKVLGLSGAAVLGAQPQHHQETAALICLGQQGFQICRACKGLWVQPAAGEMCTCRRGIHCCQNLVGGCSSVPYESLVMGFATKLADDLCTMPGLIMSRAAIHTPVHLGCCRDRSRRRPASDCNDLATPCVQCPLLLQHARKPHKAALDDTFECILGIPGEWSLLLAAFPLNCAAGHCLGLL